MWHIIVYLTNKFVLKYFEVFQNLSNFHWKHNCIVGTQWNSLALVRMNWFSKHIGIQIKTKKKMLPKLCCFIHQNVSVLQTTAPGKERCPHAMQPLKLYFFAVLLPSSWIFLPFYQIWFLESLLKYLNMAFLYGDSSTEYII